MHVLVTGGAGYIGSHTCVALLEAGHEITVIDNLCNSSGVALERVQEIAGKPLTFIRGDIRSPVDLDIALTGGVDAVIHFSALKAVGESCEKPLAYFDNNIGGTIALLQAMERVGVRRLVFSSSATVYGDPDKVPVTEEASLRVTKPYGRSKLVMEDLIRDCCQADPALSAVLLRYFNPVGAHPTGRIGEDPTGVPNNLMPYVAQVAVGRRERLQVFGGDYPTPDGTGERREGDVAALWADPTLAKELLGWAATRDLDDMCRDSWLWQRDNRFGYRSATASLLPQADLASEPQVVRAGSER